MKNDRRRGYSSIPSDFKDPFSFGDVSLSSCCEKSSKREERTSRSTTSSSLKLKQEWMLIDIESCIHLSTSPVRLCRSKWVYQERGEAIFTKLLPIINRECRIQGGIYHVLGLFHHIPANYRDHRLDLPKLTGFQRLPVEVTKGVSHYGSWPLHWPLAYGTWTMNSVRGGHDTCQREPKRTTASEVKHSSPSSSALTHRTSSCSSDGCLVIKTTFLLTRPGRWKGWPNPFGELIRHPQTMTAWVMRRSQCTRFITVSCFTHIRITDNYRIIREKGHTQYSTVWYIQFFVILHVARELARYVCDRFTASRCSSTSPQPDGGFMENLH